MPPLRSGYEALRLADGARSTRELLDLLAPANEPGGEPGGEPAVLDELRVLWERRLIALEPPRAS